MIDLQAPREHVTCGMNDPRLARKGLAAALPGWLGHARRMGVWCCNETRELDLPKSWSDKLLFGLQISVRPLYLLLYLAQPPQLLVFCSTAESVSEKSFRASTVMLRLCSR